MEFYKARLLTSPKGLQIWFNIYKSVHETNCCYFCVSALDYQRAIRVINSSGNGNPVTALNKSHAFTVRRIMKSGSRIASKTKEDAISNLIYRTKLRINHLEREIKFCHSFLKNKDLLTVDYNDGRQLIMNVLNTKDTVDEFCIFD